MEQAAVGSSERWRQAAARWRRRRLLLHLGREGAQEELLPKVGETVGGFVLEARLGAGSYGTVYRARRGATLYALKLLYLRHTGDWAQRELEVMLRLHHARLRHVECHGHYHHHPEAGPLFLYIVMDYVPGRPLDEHVQRHNPAARWVARAVLALAGELAVAHSVTVDLWALGVLLYWLLTGTWPFHGRKDEEVRDAVLGTRPVPPHERNPRVPRALSEVCLRMLEKEPGARYPDAQAVREALEAALAQADADWDVALCEEWAPHNATTRWGAAREQAPETMEQTLERLVARGRRLSAYDREHPRRGGPVPTELISEPLFPEAEEPLPEEAEALEPSAPVPPAPEASVRQAEAPAPAPPVEPARVREAAAVPASEAVAVTSAVAASRPRARPRSVCRGGVLALGVVALAAAVSSHTASAPLAAASPGAPVPALSATPVSWTAWVLSGQEMAPGVWPLGGGEGAAPAWASTPAPVAFATLPEDNTRVRTPQNQPQQKRGTVGRRVANALCTAAVGVAAAGCPGAQVRATPEPESCPPGSLEAMRQLGIRTGDETNAEFPGVFPQDLVTVQEGPGARTAVGRPLGQLETDTVLTGKFLFGKERVYGRFTQARRPDGNTFPVCLDAWGRRWSASAREGPAMPGGAGAGAREAGGTDGPARQRALPATLSRALPSCRVDGLARAFV